MNTLQQTLKIATSFRIQTSLTVLILLKEQKIKKHISTTVSFTKQNILQNFI